MQDMDQKRDIALHITRIEGIIEETGRYEIGSPIVVNEIRSRIGNGPLPHWRMRSMSEERRSLNLITNKNCPPTWYHWWAVMSQVLYIP
jgi:hypothetical protein